LAVAVLAAADAALQAGDAASVPFGTRTGFEPTAIEAPPIAAHRAGAAAGDVYALPIQALGHVASKTVADIGAGRGRILAGVSAAVGEGELFATEISESGCEELRAVASGAGLDNVTVVLAQKTDVSLGEGLVDVALLSDVYQFVLLLDGRSGQDKHAFLTSLHRALAPGGEVVVTYVTSSELKQEPTRRALLERTLADFAAYGFEPGRRWVLAGPHWPVLVMEFRSPAEGPASPGVHMGREIAQTMHWKGGEWLLRSDREREEETTKMLAALGVEPGQTVADFGCGNGYHTLELARRAGPTGVVYGVDIQPEMLTMLEQRAAEADLKNVVSIRGSLLAAPLPTASCDLILLADVYHELSHPVPMLAEIRRALTPTGRVAVLEFRAEDPDVPIKPLHKMTRAQVVAEFEGAGLRADGEMSELPWQHLLFFRAADQ
jgi:ubiquinone/menaquinone biosynthesis C-methylase UbiE